MRSSLCLLLLTSTAMAAPPAPPSNVVLTAPFVTRLRLDWQDNSNDEAGFDISYRVGTSGAFTALGRVEANSTFLDLNGASALTTYQFQIRSYLGPDNAREYSDYAGPATATTPGFINPPALATPVVAGTPPPDQSLEAGATPSVLSLTGLFTDPDVTTAARMVTALGNLDFVFYDNITPLTVANFLGYLNRGDFVNTIFHRAASLEGGEPFVIQGGAFRADATASAGPVQPAIPNEPLINNLRGTISMAKIGGDPDSATNQFFISLRNNIDRLNPQNGGFTVFGRVAGGGMVVADAIAALKRGNYTSTNGALAEVPVLADPAPAAYDAAQLVRFTAASAIPPFSITSTSSQPAIVTAIVDGSNLTLTPISPGTATITLTATDLDNQPSPPVTFQVTVRDAYETWAGQQSFANPADALPAADPDGDGQSNLIEFALPSPPLTSSPSSVEGSLEMGRLQLVFPLRNNLSGTTVALESAESTAGPWISRWSPSDGFTHPWIASRVDQGIQSIITARSPEVPPAGRLFLRLKISRP